MGRFSQGVDRPGLRVNEMPIRFQNREHSQSKVSPHVIAPALMRVSDIGFRRPQYAQTSAEPKMDRPSSLPISR